ncbi:MAG: hypothetical protein UR50_C0001G0001 [Parcubacteria group bacterium GW2011_GWC1_34_10]|uniref:Uncharacterized protein n=1 Tax=Candidatus Zambryskibacteria bacterium RIFCSPLOWO2_01_FULL_35_19 TaxID=1802757 RepID=A0A1G2TVN6_9BACT|nr:MAG: hypothetical protein UR50_C0001G0001 [Parcubacteria group bacterium GW2011_GWC1_34_10]OHA87163.1 MAG: hypothetical protein A2726_00825 [Candidatus Zambryskibacteria bacterium RIFCSPHIGHO2_01_FULL_35_32]OHB01274.1 MAG: hypothetical protein A3A90_02300 [Candidatus Zambryskibacteria bacterium RIFCSPLOWO2_01_FULL_35_19]
MALLAVITSCGQSAGNKTKTMEQGTSKHTGYVENEEELTRNSIEQEAEKLMELDPSSEEYKERKEILKKRVDLFLIMFGKLS